MNEDKPIDADSIRKEWGLGNWEVEADYAYVKGLTDEQIRWEFRRRNRSYRAIWQRYNNAKPKNRGAPVTDPRLRGDQLPEDFSLDLCTKGGLPLDLHHPTSAQTAGVAEQELDAWHYAYYGWQLTEIMEQGYRIICFDPSRAIKPQIERAREILRKDRAEARKEAAEGGPPFIDREGGPEYPIPLLRILDANAVDVSDKEIGEKIYGKEDYDDAAVVGFNRRKDAERYRDILW